jgi:methionyl aminopeptidase
MRQAGLVVWKAHQEVSARVRPGVTTSELDQAAEEVFSKSDATPLFLGVPGKVPFPAVTCTSVNEQIVHGIPGERVLQEGDIVSVDTGCRVNGWCGDAAATYPVGRISDRVQKLLDVTSGVLELAIELMGSMKRWSEVSKQMQKYVEQAGFSVVRQFVGHGIGREMHEAPQVPNFYSDTLRREEDFQLRPGLVLAIEPMVNMGVDKAKCLDDHWTQVSADGSWSAHFEHTVALTREGPVRLTGPPQAGEATPF